MPNTKVRLTIAQEDATLLTNLVIEDFTQMTPVQLANQIEGMIRDAYDVVEED